MNINVNYELWIILMCQYRFISFNKGATVVGDFKMDKATDTWQNEKKINMMHMCMSIYICVCVCVCVYTVSHSVMSDSLQPHGV